VGGSVPIPADDKVAPQVRTLSAGIRHDRRARSMDSRRGG
jgi:hypothetical protein